MQTTPPIGITLLLAAYGLSTARHYVSLASTNPMPPYANRARAATSPDTPSQAAIGNAVISSALGVTISGDPPGSGAGLSNTPPEAPFTIAIIPDPQYLTAKYTNLWWSQCAWIVSNAAPRNIKAMACVGDLVDNALDPNQWTNALAGLNLVKAAGIPFILAPGNHDCDVNGRLSFTNLAKYLPNSWFSNGTMGWYQPTNLLGGYLFITNGVQPYLLIETAWLPKSNVMAWCQGLTATYPTVPTMYITHVFTDDSPLGRLASWNQPYDVERAYGNYGICVTPTWTWRNWLRNTRNVFATYSGHLTLGANAMHFTDYALDGHACTHNLADFQFWHPAEVMDCGVMQLLTVDAAQNQCRVETFSPGGSAAGVAFTNWNERYMFPFRSGGQQLLSLWQADYANSTASPSREGLVAWAGFETTVGPVTNVPDQGPFGTLANASTPAVTLNHNSYPPIGIIWTSSMAQVTSGGVRGNCFYASTNYVVLSDIDATTGLSNVTVSAWLKSTNWPGLALAVAKFNSGNDGEWFLGASSDHNYRWSVIADYRTNVDTTTLNVVDGNWHHVAGTYDGANVILYVDGASNNFATLSGPIASTRYPVVIGKDSTPRKDAIPYYPWFGFIDEVKIWDRALSAVEVAEEYLAGKSAMFGMTAWLEQYGLPTDGSADFIDSDGDGMNNWQEWICGTCPTNAESVLRLLSATPTGTNVTVTWQSVAGVNYFLQYSTNLSGPPCYRCVATNIPGQAGVTSYADTNAAGAGPLFYRVGVKSP